MSKFAIIETGGKQYKISNGQKLKIEKLPQSESGEIKFDKVLLIADEDSIKIGQPYIEGASINAKILKQGKARKKIVFRYHSKTRYRKKKGHRQRFTEVQVAEIRT